MSQAERAADKRDSPHLQDVGGEHLRPVEAPRHFRIATLRSFCCTKTRVTLQTPMPPSTTITKPTRLRKFSARSDSRPMRSSVD